MTRRSALRSLAASLTALALVALAGGTDARAAKTYFSKGAVLKSFFSTSKRVTYKLFELDPAQRKALGKRLGYPAPAKTTLYYGLDAAGQVTGYALIDQEQGQHEPITFAVLIDPAGRMQRLEIMVYREPHGDEVRERRFRQQFVGKSSRDPVRHGRDIVAISGATISSKAMAVGAKRALMLVDELVLRPALHLSAAR